MHFLSRKIANAIWTLRFVRLMSPVEDFEQSWLNHTTIIQTQNHSTKATKFNVDIDKSHGRTTTDSIRRHSQ
jgi:hypothetical protein